MTRKGSFQCRRPGRRSEYRIGWRGRRDRSRPRRARGPQRFGGSAVESAAFPFRSQRLDHRGNDQAFDICARRVVRAQAPAFDFASSACSSNVPRSKDRPTPGMPRPPDVVPRFLPDGRDDRAFLEELAVEPRNLDVYRMGVVAVSIASHSWPTLGGRFWGCLPRNGSSTSGMLLGEQFTSLANMVKRHRIRNIATRSGSMPFVSNALDTAARR